MASPSSSEQPPAQLQKYPRPDDQLALARLIKRRHDLLRQLGEIAEEEALIRHRIRESGEVEPDSILFLSDDAIRAVIKYLSITDLSTFEVCDRLRRLITPRWDDLLVNAEKRTGARRPAPRGTGSGLNAYCSKLSLMYLLRLVDRAVSGKERSKIGERNLERNFYAIEKTFCPRRYCDHVFVRISLTPKATNTNDGSSRLAWQGFVPVIYAFGGDIPFLTLPEEASLYELLPDLKALRETFKALQRKDISLDEWNERVEAAVNEASEQAVVSVVATSRIDCGENCGCGEKCGAIVSDMIVSDMITSSQIDGKQVGTLGFLLSTKRAPHWRWREMVLKNFS